MIELPLLLRSMKGREYVLKAQVYVIEAVALFLCGNQTLEHWGANLNIKRKVLETCVESLQLDYKIIKTVNGYYGIKLETRE